MRPDERISAYMSFKNEIYVQYFEGTTCSFDATLLNVWRAFAAIWFRRYLPVFPTITPRRAYRLARCGYYSKKSDLTHG